METKIDFRPIKLADIMYLANNMRQSDVDELRVTCGLSPLTAVMISAATSENKHLQAGFVNDHLACIWGVRPCPDGSGVPWVLGTDLLDGYFKTFTRGTREIFKAMLVDYPVLYNVIDKRNERVIKWLASFGCEFHDSPEFVPGYPLYTFVLRAK